MIMYFPRIIFVDPYKCNCKVHCIINGSVQCRNSWNIKIPYKYVDLIHHEDFINVMAWIHKNIVIPLNEKDPTYVTIDVLIRIATGLLDKCSFDKNTKIELHNLIVHQIKQHIIQLIYRELPF